MENNSWLSILNSYAALASFVTLVITVCGGLVYIGVFKQKFTLLEQDMKKVLRSVNGLNSCVSEIQVTLRSTFKNKNLIFTKEIIDLYGQSNSPVVLKDELKPLVINSGLDHEVTKNLSELVSWLSAQKPMTGLGAQKCLSELVESNEVEKYLDVKKFKEYLYEHGGSPLDYVGILTLYLFERVIPEVIEETDLKVKKIK